MTCALDHTAGYRHGRVPRAVRERQLLALAEELFAERGYQRASMDELARRAGVSKPVIYDVFGSKEELHRRLLQRAADELAESVVEATAGGEADPDAQLRAASLAFFRFIEGHRQAWKMLFTDESGVHAAHVRDIRVRQTGVVIALLTAQAAEAGVTVDPQRIEAAANALNGAFECLAAWWTDHSELSAETLSDWLGELVLPGLRALVSRRDR
jgi:AcrR family transcriptional regulator